MEQDFQTSFIPKKPVIQNRDSTSRPVSLLAVVTVFVFLTMLVATGALYFYKSYVVRSIAKMENNLNLAKNRFEPSRITQLQVLDKRLRASSEILNQHIAISPIFKVLEEITMKTVRYTDFAYELGTGGSQRVTVKMKGVAVGYRSIALQADLFSGNSNLIDPIFSNLSLDDKGNVVFNLEFLVDPSLVNYKQILKAESDGSFSPNSSSVEILN